MAVSGISAAPAAAAHASSRHGASSVGQHKHGTHGFQSMSNVATVRSGAPASSGSAGGVGSKVNITA
jgi:hypothetical protein